MASGHAGDLADRPGAIDILEPGIAIGVHPAVEAGEAVFGCWPLRSPEKRYRAIVRHWSEDNGEGGRGCLAAPGAFVAGIGPEPRRLGLAGAGGQHADGRVVGEDRLGRQDVAPDGIGERLQQGGDLSDPVGQGRAVEVEPFTVKDLALAVKRQMIGIFADHHIGQKARPRAPPLDRARG